MNTNKIDLIKAEVEKLKSQLLRGACSSQIAMETMCKEEAYNEVLAILDTMQEEPVSKVWHRGDEFKDIEYQRICKKVIGNMENKRFAIGDVMEVENGAIDLLYEDGCVAMCIRKEDTWAYIEDLLNLSNVQRTTKDWKEPVSEDLEEASEEYAYINWQSDDYHDGAAEGLPFDAIGHTQKTFKAGAKWQKEQMMAKAKSGTVQKDNQVILDNGTYIDLDPSMQLKPSFVGLKEGDRIKVIIIKED